MMPESPRIRRLRSDLRALQQLHEESTILRFSALSQVRGEPPDSYNIVFHGLGLHRHEGSEVLIRDQHGLQIRLGAGYPRQMPELRWKTPIFHPNISASGIVCLGGFGAHWVPSLQLDKLCSMLWDMIRYKNFDTSSPFNRDAAAWAMTQQQFRFPIDTRPLRDRLQATPLNVPLSQERMPVSVVPAAIVPAEIVYLNEPTTIVDAELVEADQPDVVFVDP